VFSVCELLPKNPSTLAVMTERKDHMLSATEATFPASASHLSAPASTLFSLLLHPALSMDCLSPSSLTAGYGQQRQEAQCHGGLLLTTTHTRKLQHPDERSISI